MTKEKSWMRDATDWENWRRAQAERKALAASNIEKARNLRDLINWNRVTPNTPYWRRNR